jgi:hypothetical protein
MIDKKSARRMGQVAFESEPYTKAQQPLPLYKPSPQRRSHGDTTISSPRLEPSPPHSSIVVIQTSRPPFSIPPLPYRAICLLFSYDCATVIGGARQLPWDANIQRHHISSSTHPSQGLDRQHAAHAKKRRVDAGVLWCLGVCCS